MRDTGTPANLGSQAVTSAAPTPLDRLGALLLELYRLAVDCPTDQFQGRALTAVRQWIHFDSAMWFIGKPSTAGPLPHSVYLDRQPQEMMTEYEHVKQYDALSLAALDAHGTTVNASAADPRFVPHPDLFAYTRRFGLAHALTTMCADLVHLTSGISLFRASPDQPYSESDRQFAQALVPHLAGTWSQCRLRAIADSAGSQPIPQVRALCDHVGVLHVAAPSFAATLRREWPDWQGPVIPEALQGDWLHKQHGHFAGKKIVATCTPFGALKLIRLRMITPLDSLTAREQEVARRFGGGADHKAVATALHVSPITVRNHLHSVYKKLGVSDKASLAHLLRDSEA